MNGLDQCVACRDYDGAERVAIEYAKECIFGGGHNYQSGDALTGADADTCRECAEEALREFCRRVEGAEDAASAATDDWIDRVAERAEAAAQGVIDEL